MDAVGYRQSGALAQVGGGIPQKNACVMAALRSIRTSCEVLCAAVPAAARPAVARVSRSRASGCR